MPAEPLAAYRTSGEAKKPNAETRGEAVKRPNKEKTQI